MAIGMTNRSAFFIPRPKQLASLAYPSCHAPSPTPKEKLTMIKLFVGALALCIILGVGILLTLTLHLQNRRRSTDAQSSHTKNVSSPFDPHACACGCPSIEPVLNDNSTSASARIINGHTARAHSWPWQVLLLVYDIHRQPVSYCGATLITARHVLTAAHCVHGHTPPFIFVFPGQHTFNLSLPLALGYPVSRVYIHEQFNVLLQHDLAIVTVDHPFRFDSHTQPICLSKPSSRLLQVNDELIAIGWGRMSATPGTNIRAQHLQQVQLTYMPNSHPNCSEIFRPVAHIHPGQMCAGKPNRNACQGDSGGPLMRHVHVAHTDTSYWEQVGVASKTIDCGWNTTWPDIYINVAYYHEWIVNTIERLK